jgi:hypothetical protein
MSSVSLLRLPNGADQRHEAISRAIKQASGLRFISWSGEQLLICRRCRAPLLLSTRPPKRITKSPYKFPALRSKFPAPVSKNSLLGCAGNFGISLQATDLAAQIGGRSCAQRPESAKFPAEFPALANGDQVSRLHLGGKAVSADHHDHGHEPARVSTMLPCSRA